MDNIEQLKQELEMVKFKYETIIERFKFGLTPVPDPVTGDLSKIKELIFKINALEEDEVCVAFGVEESKPVETTQAAPAKVKSKRPGPPVNDKDWITSLEVDPTYSGINILEQLGKMSHWCLVNNKTATRRRFINWLNRTEKPLTSHGSGPHNSRNEQTGAANSLKDRLSAIEAEARNADQTGVEGGTFGLSVGPTL